MRVSNLCIVVSAPSGSGKSTIINRLLAEDDRFLFSVSTTTRPIRTGEVHGKHYYFVKEEEFRSLIECDGCIEWNRVHGNLYGITKKEIDRIQQEGRIPIFDVDVQGADVLRKVLDYAVFIFIIPPSRKELEHRLRNRKTDSEEQIRIRLANSIEEIKKYDLYDYVIINNDIDVAVAQMKAIATAELCSKERVTKTIRSIVEDIS